jgi:hypothetical protein
MLTETRRTLVSRVSGGFCFEVVGCGDAGDGVVDRGAAASALAEDPVVLAAGDGVFDACAAFPEPAAVSVAGDAPVGAAPG